MKKIFGVDLPEAKKGNEIKIMLLAKELHERKYKQCSFFRQPKRTKWEKYWISVYDLVINVLKKGGEEE